MNMFVSGILVGFGVFGVIAIIVLLFKLYTDILTIKNALQLMWTKISKIEKMSESTMSAAEGFVDALRRSAEGMMGMQDPMHGTPDEFRELRETFEDGIRNLEDDSDEDEEPWKKNK
jgi:leucyl aminopeptidase (aminopeptidase T)